jgi:hypothetical protein
MVKSLKSVKAVTDNSVKKTSRVPEPEIVTSVSGNHLTVNTYSNGKVVLIWDDEALAREVREAIEAYELAQKKPAVRAKAAVRKKKTNV